MSKPPHHIKQEVCLTRAPYREGRKPTAVKVYTIHNEAKYLLVQGVPMVGASNELVKLFEVHGDIEEHRILDDYPCEQFTETHLFKYKKIQSARFAKRKLDDWSFYGGVLHVCYAPEFETLRETSEKLSERRRAVEYRIRQFRTDGTYTGSMCIKQDVLDSSKPWKNTNNKFQNIHLSSNSQPDCHSLQTGVEELVTSSSLNNHYDHHSVIQTSNVYDPGFSVGNDSLMVMSDLSQQNPYYPMYSNNTVQNNGHSNSVPNSSPAQKSIENIPQASSKLSDVARQQAQSLQQYGTNTNKRTQDQTSASVQEKSETVSKDESDDEQLFLPPPPKQMKTNYDYRNRPQYDGARVPSAQAGFPANFDARTVKDSPMEIKPNGVKDSNTQKEMITKTLQQKVEENLKSTNVVIKSFNKSGPAPKFVPRQAANKMKTNTSSRKPELRTDTLNHEIRTNAFKLGKVQGPADKGPCTSNEDLDTKEKTVIDSVLSIRKKLANV